MELAIPEIALRLETSKGRTDWMRASLEPGFSEAVYHLPRALIEGASTRLRIEGRYAAYSYWVFQAKTP